MAERVFGSPRECAADTDRRAERMNPEQYWSIVAAHRRAKERQIKCGNCGRYRWPDDRCNHFEPQRSSQGKKGDAP